MVFVKVVKNKAYFKRYQVKYRRRREGKTDYFARRILVKQEKSKYNSPKHRLVCRMTNKRVICQVMHSTIQGDICVASADSSELCRYGIPVGLKNYAAAYATGLLVARRLLKNLGMSDLYKGVTEADGEEYLPEDEEERNAFKAYLDIGLVRTTTGNRVFGAMKGAVDGGLNIPHSTKRFPGYSCEEGKTKDGAYEPHIHRDRILGVHVSKYMSELKSECPDSYARQFSKFIKQNIDPDSVSDMYKKAHISIRENPERVSMVRKHEPIAKRVGSSIRTSTTSYSRPVKLDNKQRKERVQKKLAIAMERQVKMMK
eukprot:GHVR01077921.1.p1 GENE.GHVR01077921.1~~GHVR01077921.1.p1  ORF type:complete len:328 (+),score=46.52 GHVR01077921.1:43-984(+)